MRQVAAACILSLCVIPATGKVSFGQHFELRDRNLLSGRYDSSAVADHLVSADDWRPYPTIDSRSAWTALPEAVRLAHIEEAELLLDASWPELPATVFLEFVRTGNRSRFQDLQNRRREMLATLVLGEVFEDRGRFLDDIANGVWTISEESFWGVPAHLDLQSAGFGLPDVDEPVVDLFAAETASLMAWTLYLLGDRLDQVSPMLRDRIRSELKRRILDPNLERDDFWWMGFDPSVINNWTPWVGSNWLAVVLIAEEDRARRSGAVYKIMRSLDVFLNSYPDDGGCDEGPVYWTRAGGSMLEVLDFLHTATNGFVDIFEEPLIKSMGRYIVKGHVEGDYFINFADARPRFQPPAAVIHRFGDRIDDDQMRALAGYFAERQELGRGYIPGRFGHLGRQLMTLFTLDDLALSEARAPYPRDVWLPETEVMAARSAAGSSDGLFLAAKGGHNAENHNHNDVGNFILYVDGDPVIIDLGPGTYTRKTFSEDRYSIWNFQSRYHNVPIINGHAQQAGAGFSASDLNYDVSGRESSLTMSLSGAYPPEALINSWVRSIRLRRGESGEEVHIRDTFELTGEVGQTSLIFMTSWIPEEIRDGLVRLVHPHDSTRRELAVSYDPTILEPEVETIELVDSGLRQNWGDQVKRLMLNVRQPSSRETQLDVTFSRQIPESVRD